MRPETGGSRIKKQKTIFNHHRRPFSLGFVTKNFEGSGSGETPKYAPMQTVGISYRMGICTYLCKAQVISVSTGRDSGGLFGEFTYSVWIVSCEADPSQENTILHDVHESCLQEALS